MSNKSREALEKFSAVDLSRLKFPLDGDSSAIYNSDKEEITIPYWRVAELLNEVKVAQDMAKSALAEPPEPVGNNAKMREALAEIRLLLVRVPLSIKPDIACGIIAAKAKSALAEPPKNCDRFANETAAQIAFLNEVCLIDVTSLDDDPFDCWTNLMKYRYVKWLYAEAKGETK